MIISVTKIVRVPKIVSVPEVASGISLVPHAGDGWISVIRESWKTIRLVDIYSREWTRTGKRYPISVNRRLTKPSRPVRTHSK
jgi:hypothetical protein